jgi:hypothetical protein
VADRHQAIVVGVGLEAGKTGAYRVDHAVLEVTGRVAGLRHVGCVVEGGLYVPRAT